MRAYYPVFLNISRRKCVVVGGGQVALRKVRGLLECGADVQVVGPEICPELDRLAGEGEITVLRGPYRKGVLKGALIAIAATDDQDTNLAVAVEAKETGIPVNVVDVPGESDFIAPSCVRRGSVTLAVSTAGSSPALARKVRSVLENVFGEEYAALAEVVEQVRGELRRRGDKVDGDGWQRALDLDRLLDLLRRGEREQARSVLLENLMREKD